MRLTFLILNSVNYQTYVASLSEPGNIYAISTIGTQKSICGLNLITASVSSIANAVYVSPQGEVYAIILVALSNPGQGATILGIVSTTYYLIGQAYGGQQGCGMAIIQGINYQVSFPPSDEPIITIPIVIQLVAT